MRSPRAALAIRGEADGRLRDQNPFVAFGLLERRGDKGGARRVFVTLAEKGARRHDRLPSRNNARLKGRRPRPAKPNSTRQPYAFQEKRKVGAQKISVRNAPTILAHLEEALTLLGSYSQEMIAVHVQMAIEVLEGLADIDGQSSVSEEYSD